MSDLDPSVQAGRLTYDVFEWWVAVGRRSPSGRRAGCRRAPHDAGRLTLESGPDRSSSDADPLVDAALALVVGDAEPPTSRVLATCVPPSACRSSPTISIVRTSAIPSGSRLILVRIRSGIANASSRGQDCAPGSRAGRDLRVDASPRSVRRVRRHPLELEVHAARARLHVAAGHLCAVVAPDHAAQDVEGGVRAHQARTGVPIELGGEHLVDGREVAALGLELMRDVVTGLLRAAHLPRPAIRRAQPALIRGLSATARIEGRPVEDDRAFGRLDGDHGRLDGARIGVRVAELLAGRGHRVASRSFGVERPDHRGVDRAYEGVCTGIEGRHIVNPRRDAIEDLAFEQLGAVDIAEVERHVVLGARVLVLELDLERRAGRGGHRGLLELDGQRTDDDQVRVRRSDRAAGLGGGGAARRRGDRWRREIRPAGAGVGATGHDGDGQQGERQEARETHGVGTSRVADGRVGCSGWNLPRAGRSPVATGSSGEVRCIARGVVVLAGPP